MEELKILGTVLNVSFIDTGCHYFRGQRIIIIWEENIAHFLDISRSVSGTVDLPEIEEGHTYHPIEVIRKYVKNEYRNLEIDTAVRIEFERIYSPEEMDSKFKDISTAYRRAVISGW